jgi:hypothetical protein
MVDRIEADLQLGRHHELTGELHSLVSRHPLHEVVHRQLMLALSRSGRADEALAVFRRLRGRLVEELAVEPSPALQEVYAAILKGDPSVLPDAGSAGRAVRARYPIPAQVPPAGAGILGRDRELDSLCAALADAADGSAGTGTVIVSGCGGIGKTTLALQAAHQAVRLFPDGQLFADLRGADSAPRDPSEILEHWLAALGRDHNSIPGGLDERSALFRNLLKGRRVLILADDAADTDQIRPLIPGAAGCLLLVTSRGQLPALLDARRFDLPALEEDHATRLLTSIIGFGRAEPEAVARAVASCAGCRWRCRSSAHG